MATQVPATPLPDPPDGVYPSQILWARQESGWPADGVTPDEYLEALTRSLVSANRLYLACLRALHYRGKGDLADDIDTFQFTTSDHANTGDVSVLDTRAILRLFRMHCVPADLQAELLNLPIAAVEEEFMNGNLGLPRYALGPDILKWHSLGHTPSEIADHIDRSKQFIYEYLNRAGMTPNRKGKLSPTKRERYRDEIIRLWNLGYTAPHIAKLLDDDISPDYIRKIIQRAKNKGGKVRHGPNRPAPPQSRRRQKKDTP